MMQLKPKDNSVLQVDEEESNANNATVAKHKKNGQSSANNATAGEHKQDGQTEQKKSLNGSAEATEKNGTEVLKSGVAQMWGPATTAVWAGVALAGLLRGASGAE